MIWLDDDDSKEKEGGKGGRLYFVCRFLTRSEQYYPKPSRMSIPSYSRRPMLSMRVHCLYTRRQTIHTRTHPAKGATLTQTHMLADCFLLQRTWGYAGPSLYHFGKSSLNIKYKNLTLQQTFMAGKTERKRKMERI